MPTPQNENLRQMIDNVLEEYPNFDQSVVKRKINDHLRDLQSRRPWSGTVKRGIMDLPAAYTTGTVTATNGSASVSGSGTAFPTNDRVNTTLAAAVIENNYQEATPTVMTGISPGVWLVIGQGTGNEEAVFVTSTTATTFVAKFVNTHANGETILRSSLAGQQIKIDTQNTAIYTITGVPTPTSLLIDLPWASATATATTYSIFQAFVSFGQDCKQLLTVVNLQMHFPLLLQFGKDYLDTIDPTRSVQRQTYMAVFHETDPAGAPLWELYPRPTSKQELTYFYERVFQPLDNDYDLIPNGIRSDVIVKMTKADASRWPRHRTIENGIYYDPQLSKQYLLEAELDIQRMQVDDDNTSIMRAFWDFRRWGLGNDYWRDHDWGPQSDWSF